MLLVCCLTLRSTAVYPIPLKREMSRGPSRYLRRAETRQFSSVMLEYRKWWENVLILFSGT